VNSPYSYEDDKRDAERYRKIVNKFSPFVVRDVRRHEVFAYYISPDLEKALDEWTVQDEVGEMVALRPTATNGGSK
jgi:hypothetical protein